MSRKIKALIACEESQAVCIELRKMDIEAYSCDILDPSGGHAEWHIKGDVTEQLKKEWDLIIAFPPCTYLTVTGNRWFNVDKYGEKALKRIEERKKAIQFFISIYNSKTPYIAIENPVGVISSVFKKPDQIINPFEFGDPYEKKTCLWLKNLPPLISTKKVDPPPRTTFKSGKSMPSWYAESWKLPKDEMAKLRSKTFPGIAKAMAQQWGQYVIDQKGGKK